MESKRQTLVLESSDVQKIISTIGVDEIMTSLGIRLEEEICSSDHQNVIIPARDGFNYSKPNVGLVEWMPLYQVGNVVTIKIVGYHPNNPTTYNLPTILSTISQYDTNTGHLLGLADGVLITALRTGAASEIATRYLAHPDSKVLGLIGCGAQAITQLHAISRSFDIERVLLYDIDERTLSSFKDRMSVVDLDVDYEISNIEDIVAQADIICTATSIEVNEGPLFSGLPHKDHLHINAVGSDFPGKVEVPMDIMDKAFICADFIEQALVEGECQRLERGRIGTDLSGLLKNPDHFKKFQAEPTVFDSTGWALEDHIALNLFLKFAEELNVGKMIELESIPEDSKNPYDFIKVPVY